MLEMSELLEFEPYSESGQSCYFWLNGVASVSFSQLIKIGGDSETWIVKN